MYLFCMLSVFLDMFLFDDTMNREVKMGGYYVKRSTTRK